MADSCDQRVEILEKRSETDQFFANPDGSLTLKRFAMPQRVRRGDGWVPVDTTLRVAGDGAVVPGATVAGLRFSGGGATSLVSMDIGGARLSLSWPTSLPAPTLNGDSAVYANVLPGVDLRVAATVDGFQQVLVVKDAAAAQNPALARIEMHTSTVGLTLRTGAGGRIAAVDGSGTMVLFSDGSSMWDSPAPVSEMARAELAPGEMSTQEWVAANAGESPPHRVEPIEVQVAGNELAILPNADMLTASDTVFPLFIDPPFSKGSGSNWTTVNSCNTNSSYWTSNRDTMRVGKSPGDNCRYRAFVNIPTSDLAGTLIKSASFFSNMDHSSPCGQTPEVRLAVTTQQWISPASSVTWNNTADYATYWGWVIKIVRPYSANEAGGCGSDQGDKLVEWGDAYVADVVQWFANAGHATTTFSIYATDESTIDSWKKFYADSSYLQANYNRKPNLPTGQSITDCTVKCASPAVVSRRDPQLKTFATDPDGGNLNLYFEVQKSDGTPVVTSPAVAYASGSPSAAQWRVAPALAADGGYRWRVKSCDEWNDCSDPTGWFDFTVDTVPPPLPSVTPVNPNLYFADDGSGSSSGGIGFAGQFTLSGDATIDSFTWQLDGGAATTVSATGTNPRTAVITVTPSMDMTRTLTVTSKDDAGWPSSPKNHVFRVASPEPTAGYWSLNGNALDSRDFTGKPNAVHHDGTAANVTWVDVSLPGDVQNPRFRGVASFNGSGSITVGHPVLATVPNPATPTVPRSFTVAAWVRFDGTVAENQNRTVVSQQGSNKSLFELGYQAGLSNNFCFTMFGSDSASEAGTRACVSTPVTTGEWVHLAGVYNDSTNTMTLYVHRLDSLGFVDTANVATATASFSLTWSATGTFTIGRAYSGGPAAYWKGVMDEVYAAQYAATQDDVQGWAQAFEISE